MTFQLNNDKMQFIDKEFSREDSKHGTFSIL